MSQNLIPVSFIEATHALNDGHAIQSEADKTARYFKVPRSLLLVEKISSHLSHALGEKIETPSEILKVVDKKVVQSFQRIEDAFKADEQLHRVATSSEYEAWLKTEKVAPADGVVKVEEAVKPLGVDAYLKPA